EKELGISAGTNQTIFGSDDADAIEGGALIDHLYGGESNDTLTGNGGNDYLEGGLGDDTYIINDGDGVDTILDIDGLGSILYKGEPLSGGLRVAENTWVSADHLTTYTLSGDTLFINENIQIQGFTKGELGIIVT
ncbi:calcium-binding protein, partial [Methylocucumis oryzae]